MVLAVDLATRNIGIIVYDTTLNKVYWKQTLSLAPFDKTLKENVESIKDTFTFIKKTFKIDNLLIELANFRNPKVTQMFAFYAGVIYSIFSKTATLKYFNSNAWQMLIGCKSTDTSEVRKIKARKYVIKHNGDRTFVNTWTQDEIDAYCIAHNWDKIKSYQQQHKEVLSARRQKARAALKRIRISRSKTKRITTGRKNPSQND